MEWRVVFWVMFGTLIGSNFVFLLFASGELQPWNEPQKPKFVENGQHTDSSTEKESSDTTEKDTTELTENTNYRTIKE